MASGVVASPEHKGKVQTVPLDRLVIASDNVRRKAITAGLDELAASLERIGQQQPIVVEPVGEDFRIVIGQRRYLAAKQLKWRDLRAVVLDEPLDDVQRAVISLSENVQRRDLEPSDKAAAIAYLRGQLGSIRAVADAIGTSKVTVRKWLGYGAVPDSIRELVTEGKLTVPAAIRISQSVPDEDRALEIAQRVVELAPPKEARDRILTAVEEYAERPVDLILQKAEEAREQVEIHFILPERWSRAIEEYSRRADREPSDIAREATIEWLQAREY